MPLIILNKPFRVLSQFSDKDIRETLARYINVPRVYPAGRLDFDSEGLLLLTDDGKLQSRISDPRSKLAKHYWVQVDGTIDADQVSALVSGIELKDGVARAIDARQISQPAGLWQRDPPIRVRKNIPTSWLDIVISEGRNRQVRRMTAAAGLPALRLVRHRVGPWTLDDLQPGMSRMLDNDFAWGQLAD